jgi:histone deacetylase 1/2
MKASREDWKMEASMIVIEAELRMLFEELRALRCVRRAAIKAGTKILNSHMFVVDKYLTNGSFDKMKARLVADGRDQDVEMYPDKSSPTVAVHLVFTALGLASSKPWWIVVKIDIKGAFIQTPMKGEPVYMKIDPKISLYVVNMFSELGDMLEEDGCLYMLLLKAMYGCIQASALWYEPIKSFILELGYECSKTDRCVFRKRVGNRVSILLLYVDDILAQVDEREVKRLRVHLKKRFGEVQFEIGEKLSYLGMQINIKDEGTTVDMSFYIKKLLEGTTVKGQASPGNHSSFIVDKESQLLDESERKYFHSTMAKLLYLAKHARPDILTLVIFLCTRVQYASKQDKEKLERVLGYLKWTEEEVLVLKPCVTGEIVTYVDVAYTIHNDSKSHTGVIIYVGNTLVYVSSKKQKCMSKSPTEAELIGLTDNLGLIELFHEFVDFVTMRKVNPPTIYQDCNAVVSLVTKAGGQTRTKHLRARINLGKEMVNEKRVIVKYIRGEDMDAHGFSKPYDPAEHKKLKNRLMPSVNGDNGRALNIVQGEDPGEIQAKSQNGTQQDAKQRSVVEKRNGKKSETAK